MRRAFFLLLGMALSSALAVNTNYYPHAPGNYWTYNSGEMQVVGKAVSYKGVSVIPLNHQFGKILVRQDLLEYRSDGSVWLRGVNQGGKLQWYAAPLNIYPPGPLKMGQEWATGASISRVVGSSGVKNQAGTYNALIISTETPRAGRAQLAYFVPGVGVVRYQTAEGGITELIKYR